MNRKRKRKCRFCPTLFVPDPRLESRQQTCDNPTCRKALKTENNASWRKANPDYFRNDYLRVKQWLADHPGYLRHYRLIHPEYVENNRKAQRRRDRLKKLALDIQASIISKRAEINQELADLPRLAIQDSIFSQPFDSSIVFATLPCFSRLDIQDSIDFYPSPHDNLHSINFSSPGCPHGP
jgi:hypothetical protein